MSRQVNIFYTLDWFSIVLYFLLVVFGWMNILAVNYQPENFDLFSLSNRYSVQLIFIVIAVLIILAIFAIESRFFTFVAYPAYGLAILTLLAVLIIGTTVNNSKSWIAIGSFRLQPAEFAKVATILAISKYLSGLQVKTNKTKDILIAAGIISVPFLLIMAQPDFGSAVVYFILILVLYREGMPGWVLFLALCIVALFLGTLLLSQFTLIIVLAAIATIALGTLNRKPILFLLMLTIEGFCLGLIILLTKYTSLSLGKMGILLSIIALTLAIGIAFALAKKIRYFFGVVGILALTISFSNSVDFVFNKVMKPHQRNRVNVMLGIQSDPLGYEYNVRQSKIAIGSGGFAGKGFLQGTQTKFKFVPEQSTDFIFCTIGEEWGFLGTFTMVFLFIGLLTRLIILAERQRSRFSRTYGYAVISILFFHFAVNVGMTIGLFPVIGIPLPFISYGGSSLIAFTIMLFIFIRLDSTRASYLI